MKYKRLGSTGLVVSRVSLGMMSYGSPGWQAWVLPKQEARRFVQQALDAGVNTFDTADFYSIGESENALGDAIHDLGVRHEVVLASKVGLPMSAAPNGGGLSKKHVLASLDASLRRLRTDYLDLYQLHRFDPHTPIDETLDALDIAVRAGKVLYAGASNFSTAQIAPAVFANRWRPAPPLASMQVQYNLLYREEERDMLPLCRDNGIGVIVYSPLARGWLIRNPRQVASMTEREALRAKSDRKAEQLYGSIENAAVLAAVHAIAQERGVTPARIALAWLHAQPAVSTVLCGALEPQHLTEALAAVDLELSADECRRLEEPYVPQAVKDDAFAAVKASAGNDDSHSSK